jgi:hypothetical protein
MTMSAAAGMWMISPADAPRAPMSAPMLMTLTTVKSTTSRRRVRRLYRFLMLRASPWPVTLPIRPQASCTPVTSGSIHSAVHSCP